MGGGDGLFEIEIYIPKTNVITLHPKKKTPGVIDARWRANMTLS